jgi:hypothetical protein
MSYAWGDLAPSTRQVAGSLIDSQPGTGEGPLWNLIHRVTAPITGATLDLQSPTTREHYRALSDENGAFEIHDAPSGVYVLHVEGGQGRDYEPTDLLLRLSPKASRGTLELIRTENGCGRTSLDLQPERRAN